MKAVERRQVRALRQRGWSVGSIARQLQCATSSVSQWIRDIPLTAEQVNELESRRAHGWALAANHPNSPKHVWARIRQQEIEQAERQVPVTCPEGLLKLIGSTLYWAEGAKADRCGVNFSNTDPDMIALMMVFFRNVCGVAETKFRGVVHIHPHLDAERACAFWSRVSGIPLAQFHRTQIAISRASKQKRDTLPLGTFRIVVSDTWLKCRIQGWIRGIARWHSHRAVSSAG